MPDKATHTAAVNTVQPRHASRAALAVAPRHFRTSPARGLTEPVVEGERVERTGGDFGAGLIRGVSLCTRGEALGHGYWLDREFIASVTDSAHSDAGDKGVKARFTHPGLSADGLGTFLGRFKNHRLSADGEKAVADLHFSLAAHRSPDGDLAEYVMGLAESDPEAFAVSIVFEPDMSAESQFALENGATVDSDGYLNWDGFASPDSDNAKNLRHARLKSLRAADMVDEPAANPDGLFHREQQFATEADDVLCYALGLRDDRPACVNFSVDPDRAKAFIHRFCEAHGLELQQREENSMPPKDPDTAAEAEAQNTPENEQAETTDTDNAASAADATAENDATSENDSPAAGSDASDSGQDGDADQNGNDAPDANLSEGRRECGRFIEDFGAQGGEWYAQGLSYEQAQQQYAAALKAENEALRKRLHAAGEGEDSPVDFQPGTEPGGGSKSKAAADPELDNKLGANLGRVARGIAIKGK